MFYYVKGTVAHVAPFLAVIDCGGSAMPAGPPILRSPAWKRERPPRSIPT